MAIGRIDYISDGEIATAPDVFLAAPESASPEWSTAPPWFDERGWVLPVGGFLLRTREQVILIDAGLGPSLDPDAVDEADMPVRHVLSGGLLDSLTRLQVTPDEVTDVVVTHLHGDHVGWIAPQGTPIFPHARHHCHHAEVEWLRSDGGVNIRLAGAGASISSVSDLLVINTNDRTEIADSVSLRLFSGHTPGNSIVDIATDDGPVLLLGDAAHHPVLLVEQDWTDHLDEDPTEAARSRHRIADEMERTGAVGLGAHFPDLLGGRIRRGRDGQRRWKPVTVVAPQLN